jgi:hypothetical protein
MLSFSRCVGGSSPNIYMYKKEIVIGGGGRVGKGDIVERE